MAAFTNSASVAAKAHHFFNQLIDGTKQETQITTRARVVDEKRRISSNNKNLSFADRINAALNGRDIQIEKNVEHKIAPTSCKKPILKQNKPLKAKIEKITLHQPELKNSLNIQATTVSKNQKNPLSNELLHQAKEAVANGNIAFLHKLISSASQDNASMITALIIHAIEKKCIDTAEIILSSDIGKALILPSKSLTEKGETALHLAAKAGDPEVLRSIHHQGGRIKRLRSAKSINESYCKAIDNLPSKPDSYMKATPGSWKYYLSDTEKQKLFPWWSEQRNRSEVGVNVIVNNHINRSLPTNPESKVVKTRAENKTVSMEDARLPAFKTQITPIKLARKIQSQTLLPATRESNTALTAHVPKKLSAGGTAIMPEITPKALKQSQYSELAKAVFKGNRQDKREHKLAFTRIKGETLTSKPFIAELLNAVPKEFLKAQNWSAADIAKMTLREKKNDFSKTAMDAFGVKDIKDPKEGLFYGKGMYGSVTPALIYRPDQQQPKWCVAKKLQQTQGLNLSRIQTEVTLQAKAGVGPEVYGISKTKANTGEDLFIIFMEPAKGKEGLKLLKDQERKLSLSQKATMADNFLCRVADMHNNGVYHCDLKPENINVGEDQSVEILDFGTTVSEKTRPNRPLFRGGPLNLAPEIVTQQGSPSAKMDMEKVDIFSSGIVLAEMFATKPEFIFTDKEKWTSTLAVGGLSKHIDQLDIPHPELKQLVLDMIHRGPNLRPTMEQIIQRFGHIKSMLNLD
ncbi:protein kinase domain-containing protein [Endozoicomonas ascidiicola]|uniref:protein kinase domain-containing protein n=1 Tax=Endozoicomonas ascidiicola TaxID=1698521 RepID=UPI00082F4B10|nr:protein kinase [Endozoicomonas ascidiicola]